MEYGVNTLDSSLAPIAQLAEAADLKSAQCRFESDWGHRPAVEADVCVADHSGHGLWDCGVGVSTIPRERRPGKRLDDFLTRSQLVPTVFLAGSYVAGIPRWPNMYVPVWFRRTHGAAKIGKPRSRADLQKW